MMDRARFEAFVLECHARPWAWGTHDCLQFAAAAALALTGIDYATRFGVYHSRLGAYRILADHADISAFIASLLGPAQPRNLARFGWIVTASGPDGESAGVCLGGRCVFAANPRGLAQIDLAAVQHCWPLPCLSS